MFQDDINRSSFDTSYSTTTFLFLSFKIILLIVIIIACESSDNRKVK